MRKVMLMLIVVALMLPVGHALASGYVYDPDDFDRGGNYIYYDPENYEDYDQYGNPIGMFDSIDSKYYDGLDWWDIPLEIREYVNEMQQEEYRQQLIREEQQEKEKKEEAKRIELEKAASKLVSPDVINDSGNYTTLKPDTDPIIIKGHTMVPIRSLAEWLGHEINWYPESQNISVGPNEWRNVSGDKSTQPCCHYMC